MADDNRWSDRDRDWRDERGSEGRGRDRGGAYGARGQGGGQGGGQGYYGGGASGGGGRGYAAQGGPDADQRWRQMHQDRRHEGAAGYNPAGSNQGGWAFGDEEQGGERGQGYDQYGYGRERSQGNYDQYGRDPGVGSAYGESWGAEREYGRGGGQGARGAGGGAWRGPQQQRGGRGGGQADYAYGSHTPYGYRGSNEYDQRGRGGEHADDGRPRGGEHRSWLDRAGETVSAFFGAEGEGQHRGRGPKGYRRSDDRIREDVSDRLTDDPWLDASNIDVEVRECEVVLSGSVTSREDKRRAENLAEAISGVKNVANNLRLDDNAAMGTMLDGAMQTQAAQVAQGGPATAMTSGQMQGRSASDKGTGPTTGPAAGRSTGE